MKQIYSKRLEQYYFYNRVAALKIWALGDQPKGEFLKLVLSCGNIGKNNDSLIKIQAWRYSNRNIPNLLLLQRISNRRGDQILLKPTAQQHLQDYQPVEARVCQWREKPDCHQVSWILLSMVNLIKWS